MAANQHQAPSAGDGTDRVTISVKRRHVRIALLVLVVAAVAFPAGMVVAANGFSDVDPGSVHAAGIDAVAAADVTVGCGGDRFCPNDNVTRAQMATFMHRLSGNAATPPWVNAASLGGTDAEGFVKRGEGAAGDLANFNEVLPFDPPAIAANSCVLGNVSAPGVDFDDITYVRPSANVSPIVIQAVSPLTDGNIRFMMCNPTTSSVDAPSGFWRFLALRP
jgi:hypothetical protein